MVDSVWMGFCYCVSHLGILALPFQILIPLFVVLGVLAGIRLVRKWYLFAGALLALALVCEVLCRLFEMELVFPLFFTGMLSLCLLAGDLIGTVMGKLLAKLRR